MWMITHEGSVYPLGQNFLGITLKQTDLGVVPMDTNALLLSNASNNMLIFLSIFELVVFYVVRSLYLPLDFNFFLKFPWRFRGLPLPLFRRSFSSRGNKVPWFAGGESGWRVDSIASTSLLKVSKSSKSR